MRYFFKSNSTYIKQIDKDRCEMIQLKFHENEVVAVFSEITTTDYNLELFLKEAKTISESDYNSIYERYAQT